jgi:hypothetical protein
LHPPRLFPSRFWEFLDTVVFVLRKSDRQITFLHLYHHTSITAITYVQIVYGLSADLYLPALLNWYGARTHLAPTSFILSYHRLQRRSFSPTIV